jgi:TolB-like protein
MLRLLTFGGLSVEGPDGPVGGAPSQRKALALLALLAPAGARGVSRDRVAAYLWPESPADKVAHRLGQLLYSLRRDLAADDVFLGTAELRLNPRVINADVQDFNRALEAGDFARGARIYCGPFLEGFFLSDASEFERWVEEERSRLAERFGAALGRLAEDARRRNDLPAAAAWLLQLSRADPLNPQAAASYLETLDALGDRAGALRFARSYEALLRAEYEMAPDPMVATLVGRLTERASPRRPSLPPSPALAVLPFLNLMPDHENEYFSDGMTEELTNALTKVPGLRVASQVSARRFKETDGDPREIAEELGVSALVSGSVRKLGNRIRVTAQLVSGADGCHLWSETYDRTLEDIFTLQEELARAIVGALPLPAHPEHAVLVRAPTPVMDAYTLYLRGRYSALKRTAEGLSLGVEYFEQAVERDPRFALAHAGLAECCILLGFPEFGTLPPLDAMPRAKAAAREALRLDPRLPEAHAWLAVIHFLFDWDWAAAEEEFRRALQLRRENAYAETWYAMFLSAMGRHEESIARMLYAEALEPGAPAIRLCVPRAHYFARQFPAALESLDDLNRVEPGVLLTVIWLGRTLWAMRRYGEALARLEGLPADQRTPCHLSTMAAVLVGLDRYEEGQALCSSLRRKFEAGDLTVLSGLAAAYASMGEQETVMDLLEAGERARCGLLAFMPVDPLYDAVRNHPRYRQMTERMRFGEVASPGNAKRSSGRQPAVAEAPRLSPQADRAGSSSGAPPRH